MTRAGCVERFQSLRHFDPREGKELLSVTKEEKIKQKKLKNMKNKQRH